MLIILHYFQELQKSISFFIKYVIFDTLFQFLKLRKNNIYISKFYGLNYSYTTFPGSSLITIIFCRLQVEDLTLTEVSSNGVCESDYMTVNQDNKWGKVCSTTKDAHCMFILFIYYLLYRYLQL